MSGAYIPESISKNLWPNLIERERREERRGEERIQDKRRGGRESEQRARSTERCGRERRKERERNMEGKNAKAVAS